MTSIHHTTMLAFEGLVPTNGSNALEGSGGASPLIGAQASKWRRNGRWPSNMDKFYGTYVL